MQMINNVQLKQSQCKNDPFQSLLSFFTTENEKKIISGTTLHYQSKYFTCYLKGYTRLNNLKSHLKFFFIKKFIYLFLNNKIFTWI